ICVNTLAGKLWYATCLTWLRPPSTAGPFQALHVLPRLRAYHPPEGFDRVPQGQMATPVDEKGVRRERNNKRSEPLFVGAIVVRNGRQRRVLRFRGSARSARCHSGPGPCSRHRPFSGLHKPLGRFTHAGKNSTSGFGESMLGRKGFRNLLGSAKSEK